MPKIRTIQQRFTQGEIDPRMRARVDVDQYYGALESALNVFPIPQGGFRRRPGLEFIDYLPNQVTRETVLTPTATNGGTAANGNDNNVATLVTTTTNIGVLNPYVVLHYDLATARQIAYVDIVGAYLSAGSSASEFKVQGSNDNAAWTTFDSVAMSTTAHTKRVRVDGSYRYIRFARIGATDLGTAKANIQEMHVWNDTGNLSDCRFIDFTFSTSQHYMLVLGDKNIVVYKDGIYQADIRVPDHNNTVLDSVNWTQSADTLLLFTPSVAPWKVQRNGSDVDWIASVIAFDYVPKFDFLPVSTSVAQTLTPSAASGNITLTAGGGTPFSAATVDQYVEGNGGRARVVEYVSGTVVKAVTEIPFFDTTAIASGEWTIESGFESVWSTTRGWPNCGVFHEGRLWIGGSASRPSTIWGSRVGLFFDFDPGSLLDDDAIDATLDTGQFNNIINLYSGRALQIFTTGGEHVVLQTLNEPITPTNFNAKKQTSVGSREGLRVVEVEGSVIYVQREGESVQEFVFADTEQAFVNNIVSLISSHLIKRPVDFALRKATSTEEGNYLLLVNDDGTLSVANILRSQNITSFAPQETRGTFKRTGVDNDNMYCMVEREIDGDTVRYIERFNFDHFMDASSRITDGLPDSDFVGLDHIEGETAKVRADDSNLADVEIVGGACTIAREASDYVEFGIDFTPLVRDLPPEVQQIGTAVGLKKNISEIVLELHETQNIVVNGKTQVFTTFGPSGGGSPLDTAPPFFTGTRRIKGQLGWDFKAQVEITQSVPAPMTVLAIVKRVNM